MLTFLPTARSTWYSLRPGVSSRTGTQGGWWMSNFSMLPSAGTQWDANIRSLTFDQVDSLIGRILLPIARYKVVLTYTRVSRRTGTQGGLWISEYCRPLERSGTPIFHRLPIAWSTWHARRPGVAYWPNWNSGRPETDLHRRLLERSRTPVGFTVLRSQRGTHVDSGSRTDTRGSCLTFSYFQ